MKPYIKNIRILIVITGLMLSLSASATTPQITFDDDVEDVPPPMPIDGLIGVALAAGAYIGLRKKMKNVR
ncbi:hypothetical protein [Dokdonia pacifica]|uniref:PEP-CTERM protein-sorting domain-containing protein n=1 Tax=Dokdonia pacifica TaxID=1627892 RepID=A0A238W7U4_9FLAO|nr:hypothetical protein [Dokdonia pacifica]SNR42364.1 hypothetical protein SAMN06265376_101762 [Dokdonia pacifica]